MDFDYLETSLQRARGGSCEIVYDFLNSCGVESCGLGVGIGKRDGAGRYGFPTAFRFGTKPPCSQGRGVLALRPAWASWMPGTVPCPSRNCVMRERMEM